MDIEASKRKYERDVKEAKQTRDQFLRPMPILEDYIAMKRQKIIDLYDN